MSQRQKCNPLNLSKHLQITFICFFFNLKDVVLQQFIVFLAVSADTCVDTMVGSGFTEQLFIEVFVSCVFFKLRVVWADVFKDSPAGTDVLLLCLFKASEWNKCNNNRRNKTFLMWNLITQAHTVTRSEDLIFSLLLLLTHARTRTRSEGNTRSLVQPCDPVTQI